MRALEMVKLGKYSIGVGDRFGQQASAQLGACIQAGEHQVELVPVWNKSNREHQIIGSDPAGVYNAAATAVKVLGWTKSWHVDADHINLQTVDRFIPWSDFFTIDVADWVGKPTSSDQVETFVKRHPELTGKIEIPGLDREIHITEPDLRSIATKYLAAVRMAGEIYRYIAKNKGVGTFITEVSMDETDTPQTPPELLAILAAVRDEEIPIQTIAPKFTGRFNKGVDYIGNLAQFEKEFNDDLCVIRFAVKQYSLPDNLKLSVHSGSDKFSLYPIINKAIHNHNAGLHLKTAGTTWLEEVIGLAEAGGAGLALAKEIYAEALEHTDELCKPYATVIDIDKSRLPSAETVAMWSSAQFVAALRHDPDCKEFNPHLRQLLHVGYKMAARRGERYLKTVRECETTIARNVTYNLFERHIKPIFLV